MYCIEQTSKLYFLRYVGDGQPENRQSCLADLIRKVQRNDADGYPHESGRLKERRSALLVKHDISTLESFQDYRLSLGLSLLRLSTWFARHWIVKAVVKACDLSLC